MAHIIVILFVGLLGANDLFAENFTAVQSWGAIKANQPAAKLVVSANAVGGEREELIFRGSSDPGSNPEPQPMLMKTFHVYHPFAGDVVIGLGLGVPAGKYRAFTFRYRTAGLTITRRSLPVPSTLDAYGYLYVMFEWRGVGADVEEMLVFIEHPRDPGYLEIYGIR